ncbi:MAG: hypothetical protein HRT45_01840 [Bdellovibrionales bacterium]|nr:hypothetical protein [Bdellovibrionales bacterium]
MKLRRSLSVSVVLATSLAVSPIAYAGAGAALGRLIGIAGDAPFRTFTRDMLYGSNTNRRFIGRITDTRPTTTRKAEISMHVENGAPRGSGPIRAQVLAGDHTGPIRQLDFSLGVPESEFASGRMQVQRTFGANQSDSEAALGAESYHVTLGQGNRTDIGHVYTLREINGGFYRQTVEDFRRLPSESGTTSYMQANLHYNRSGGDHSVHVHYSNSINNSSVNVPIPIENGQIPMHVQLDGTPVQGVTVVYRNADGTFETQSWPISSPVNRANPADTELEVGLATDPAPASREIVEAITSVEARAFPRTPLNLTAGSGGGDASSLSGGIGGVDEALAVEAR